LIRLATVPEDSAFTSIAERLQKADAGAAEDGVPVSGRRDFLDTHSD